MGRSIFLLALEPTPNVTIKENIFTKKIIKVKIPQYSFSLFKVFRKLKKIDFIIMV